MGWVDHDALWCFDVPGRKVRLIPLNSGADRVKVHTAGPDRFSLAYDFKGSRFELTVHNFSGPLRVVARATLTDTLSEVTAELEQWKDVPLLHVHYLSFAPWKDFVLLKISPTSGKVWAQRLDWYDHTYDKNYQSVIGALELPGQGLALISVQRSSVLVLHDLETGARKGTLDLGGSGGNPILRMGKTGDEIWATDYDSIVAIDAQNLRVLRRSRVQNSAGGMRQFIGDYTFAPDEDLCVIARPFSSDAVGIRTADLEVTCSAKVGGQPLELAALARGEVIARDWKTGDVVAGHLRDSSQ